MPGEGFWSVFLLVSDQRVADLRRSGSTQARRRPWRGEQDDHSEPEGERKRPCNCLLDMKQGWHGRVPCGQVAPETFPFPSEWSSPSGQLSRARAIYGSSSSQLQGHGVSVRCVPEVPGCRCTDPPGDFRACRTPGCPVRARSSAPGAAS